MKVRGVVGRAQAAGQALRDAEEEVPEEADGGGNVEAAVRVAVAGEAEAAEAGVVEAEDDAVACAAGGSSTAKESVGTEGEARVGKSSAVGVIEEMKPCDGPIGVELEDCATKSRAVETSVGAWSEARPGPAPVGSAKGANRREGPSSASGSPALARSIRS